MYFFKTISAHPLKFKKFSHNLCFLKISIVACILCLANFTTHTIITNSLTSGQLKMCRSVKYTAQNVS